ncbi:MAG: hypothetical protein WCB19_05145, partial [Thermoplasmata archaeon]
TPHRENEFPDLDEGEAVGGYGTQPEAIEGNRTGLGLEALEEQMKMAGGRSEDLKTRLTKAVLDAMDAGLTEKDIEAVFHDPTGTTAEPIMARYGIPGYMAAIQLTRLKLEMNKKTASGGGGGYLYHVTYSGRLESIIWQGLEVNRASSIGELHEEHRKGRSFFTEWTGVSFWYQRAVEWAYHNSDNPVEDGLTPVVIRTREMKRLDVQPDEIGTTDAVADAYFTEKSIPAKRLEVWNGKQWVRLTEDALASMTPEGYSHSFGGGDDWPEVGSATMERYIDEDNLYPKTGSVLDKMPSWDEFVKKEGGIAKVVNSMGTNWDRFEPYWDMTEFNELPDSEQEKVLQQNAYRELGERYNDLLDQHMSWSFPLTVYRVLTLQDIKDIKTKGIGVYWSWDEDAAEAHWGHFGQGFQNYTLKAQVQEKDVDWTGTMWVNLDPDLGEDEKEIRLKSGARPLLLAWKRGNEEWQLPLRQWRSITASKEVE